jgi:hypothetical protein
LKLLLIISIEISINNGDLIRKKLGYSLSLAH